MLLHFKRAVQDILDNKFLNTVTIITIAISILIVSAFALFFINASDIMNAWKKSIRIMAYIKPEVTNTQLPELTKKIEGLYGVRATRFISKDQALDQLKMQMKRQASLFNDLKKNPLPDAFEIQIIADTKDPGKIEMLAARIESLPEIDEVEYGQQWLARFTSIFNLFRLTGCALGILFFMAAVFITANTIRLVLYSRREEVEIMRLVGATDNFIKSPFYIEGIIQGAVGGMLGLGALFLIFIALSSNVEQGFASDLFMLRFLSAETLCGITLCSMFVGWIGCYLSLKQFLKP
jgi:cell division transport system permease protein